MKTSTSRKRTGFSLIEVTMSIGVLSVGTLALMGLFPMGLQEGIEAQADMRQAIFADFALSQASAAASCEGITTVNQFISKFRTISSLDIAIESKDGSGSTTLSEFKPSGGTSGTRDRLYYRVWIREPNDDDSEISVLRKDIHGTYLVCVQSTDRSKAGSSKNTLSMSPVYVTSIYLSGEDDLMK